MFRPAFPPRICGGSSSKHSICRRNNSFFALSNKWLNLYRQQQAQQQEPAPVPLRSRIPVSTLEYYADSERRKQAVAPGTLDRALFKSLLLAPPSLTSASNESTISNTSADASPGIGDLVEFWDPQTQGVALGVIVEVDFKHEVFQAWTLDGTRVRVKPDQITLHLSHVVAPALLKGNSKHSAAAIKTHTLALLRLIVGTGYELMRGKLADALLAVHSQTQATTPQPVARIAARALSIARVRNWTASPLTQVAALLGTHIWLANNPIYYWSFNNASCNGGSVSVNGRSKTYWVPYESTLAEESQYIVAELDTQDVVAFGEYLHARRTASQMHPIDADDEEYFESLVAFLKRYIVYPHDQYSNLVETILSHAYSLVPEMKASPEQVHKLLIECGLTNTENPLLDSKLVLSYDHETGKVTDKFSASEGSVVNLDLVPYSAVDTTHEEFDKKNLTTYVLTSSSSKLPCIGLSLDKSDMKLWELHIHVPNVSAVYEPNSRLLKLALRRLRTAHLPEGDRTLFRQPETLHKVARFFGSDEIENKRRGTKCVTFSVKFNPWKLAGWGIRDVNVSLNIVRQVTILPIEELEPNMGWSRYNGSLAWQDEENPNTILQKYLEPVNSIELGGDLTSEHTDSSHSLENDFDISNQETAMGIPNDHSFSATDPNETLNHHQRALKRRLSIFSDSMTRKDRNNMAAIQEILLNNFWKRLDAGALYVEDTERDYRLPTDVKANPDTGHVELGHRVPIVTRLVTEAEIMAGEIGALFGAKHNIPLFYSKQVLTPPGGLNNEAIKSIDDNRSLDGTLNGVGAYMADRALMDHSETVTEPRHPHFGLGVSAGYVSVARPLDDMRQLISQYQLTTYLTTAKPLTHSFLPAKKWPLLSGEQLQAFYAQNRVDERQELLEYFEKSSARYWALRWLEGELERSSGYFVFKCVVLSPAAQYPDLAKGYCLELNMEVDIMLTRRTPTVGMGDRLMCTGILRLVPTTGELVLGN